MTTLCMVKNKIGNAIKIEILEMGEIKYYGKMQKPKKNKNYRKTKAKYENLVQDCIFDFYSNHGLFKNT